MKELPERKHYQDSINNGAYIVTYDQASLRETEEYEILNKDPNKQDQLLDYITKWVQSHTKIRGWRRQKFHKLTDLEIAQIWNNAEPKLHKVGKSLYEGITIPKRVPIISKGEKPTSPVFLDERMLYVAKKSLIPQDQIKDRITFEQWQWYNDLMTYEYLESFDAGKMTNMKLKWSRGLTPDQQAQLDKILASKARSSHASGR